MIQRSLLKTILGMLNELHRDVYQRDFEQPFLQATAHFYQAESNEYISQNSACDYMKKAPCPHCFTTCYCLALDRRSCPRLACSWPVARLLAASPDGPIAVAAPCTGGAMAD